MKQDTTVFNDSKVTLWRWRDDFQNDFAARMDWSFATYSEANHPPIPVLSHSDNITVTAGQTFDLDAYNSTDPDGDNLSFLWQQYPEAGSYKSKINVGAENVHNLTLTAPNVTKPESTHFILKLSDKGSLPLSRYKRVIINIMPK